MSKTIDSPNNLPPSEPSQSESERELALKASIQREPLRPKDDAEAIAIFRSQVVGPLLTRHLSDPGALARALRELCAEPVRAPGSDVSRCYAPSTVERWYYRFRKGGLDALFGLNPAATAATLRRSASRRASSSTGPRDARLGFGPKSVERARPRGPAGAR